MSTNEIDRNWKLADRPTAIDFSEGTNYRVFARPSTVRIFKIRALLYLLQCTVVQLFVLLHLLLAASSAGRGSRLLLVAAAGLILLKMTFLIFTTATRYFTSRAAAERG